MAEDNTTESKLRARSKSLEWVNTWLGILASLAVIAAILGVFSFGGKPQSELARTKRDAETDRAISSIRSAVEDVKSQIRMNQQLLDKVNNAKPATVQIARLNVQLDSIQAQVRILDDALGQSPDKSLAIPLLRKDLDNLRDSSRRDLDATHAEINRVYDQNKWFIGLMFTLALGLLSLGVSNFLKLGRS
jgi:hypothetical protein